MKLKELLQGIPVLHTTADGELELSGVSYDSRKTEAGDLFVAMIGYQTDGHDFIDKAVKNGAICVLCERLPQDASIPYVQVENCRRALAILSTNFFGHPAEQMKIIGVTGTCG
ncbi:MAG: Mur ligase domain-containing protein, partial [Oscillospiraceae bacterium]